MYGQIGSIVNGIWQFTTSLLGGVSLGIFATLLSGVLVYAIRQHYERRKLEKALRTELEHMTGLEECADSLERSSPPTNPDEVPPGKSISTSVYDANAARLGLLDSEDLTEVVEFYSKLARYKGIMDSVRSGEVLEADENDLCDSISEVESKRQTLIDEL